jgi:hypothetical protein
MDLQLAIKIFRKGIQVLSALIMFYGVSIAHEMTTKAESAQQYLQAAVPLVMFYVIGRAIENIFKK